MIEPKDKRTIAWKEWNKQQITFQEPDGLGDIVEKITKATGIKKVVDTVAKAVDAVTTEQVVTMKEDIETLQEEKQQLTTQLYEVQAILDNSPTVTPFKLESDGSNN